MSQFGDYVKIENKCVFNTRKLNIANKSVPYLIFEKLIGINDKEILVDCEVNKRWTANEVYTAAIKIATKLLEIGVKKGDFVAAQCPNRDYKVITYLAVTGIGAVYSGCLHNAPFAEINKLIKALNASYMITSENNVHHCEDLLKQNGSLKSIFILDSEEDIGKYISIPKIIRETDFKNCCDLLKISSTVTGNDLLQIVFTSGSTGAPKAVKVTHRNISAECFVTLPDYNHVTENDTIALYMPFFEPLGVRQLVFALYSGAKACVFVEEDSYKLYNICEKHTVNVVYLLPFIVSEFNKFYTETSSIRLEKVFCSGDTLPLTMAEEFVRKFKPTFFTQKYGNSETGNITLYPFITPIHYLKSIGFPVVGAICKVVDIVTGEDLGFNQIGEIRVKSPQVFTGYLNHCKTSRDIFDQNGFYKTGDAGYYDENGCFYFVNRFTSIIKVNGWSVHPSELESIIMTNENVEKAVVVGAHSRNNDKILKAFVVIKKDKKGAISEQQLLDYVNSQVSDYKKLTGGLIFVDSLKKTRNNKLDRKAMT